MWAAMAHAHGCWTVVARTRKPSPGPRATELGTLRAFTNCATTVATIRVINAATGELLRELVLDPTRDYQPTGRPPETTQTEP
jgi:hypothetical protein